MSGLIGKKIGMTSIFDEDGKNTPCTMLEVGPCVVTQVKSVDNNGYATIQLGYQDKKDKHTPKPQLGHFKKAGTSPKAKLAEFADFADDIKLGDVIDTGLFQEGEYVNVIGYSKGKGFQGVVKRYNFKGVNDATHGQHNRLRAPGSIGASSYPSRVFKGMRMAGQMGNVKVQVRNLKVMKILPEKNVVIVNGAVPGHKGAYILIKK